MNAYRRLFGFYFSAAFCLATVGYHALSLAMPSRPVFGSLHRMFSYHEQHPLAYILVTTLTYAAVATFAVRKWSHFEGWKRGLLIIAIMAVSVLLASIPGGVLWVVHDMLAGFVPARGRAFGYLWWGAATGFEVGWIIVAISFPYSLLGAVLGFVVTARGFDGKRRMT